MIDVTFRVPDITCAHCKAAVEGELNKLSGVESSNANVETGAVEGLSAVLRDRHEQRAILRIEVHGGREVEGDHADRRSLDQ